MPTRLARYDLAGQVVVEVRIQCARDMRLLIGAPSVLEVLKLEAAVYDRPIGIVQMPVEFVGRDERGIGHCSSISDSRWDHPERISRIRSALRLNVRANPAT
jgi:hypothetical protein